MEAIARKPNAQKWTAEIVIAHLDAIEAEISKPDVWLLGQALLKARLGKHVWRYWKRIFADDEEIIERMELIDTKLESKLFVAALKNKVPARIAIWILRNVHGWGQNEYEHYT